MVEAIDFPSQLIDIVPPTIPLVAESSDAWLAMVAISAMALFTWLIRCWYRSERFQSLRRLNRLHAAFQTQELSPREVTYWLAVFLKWRLGINYLSPGVPLPIVSTSEQRRWDSFMQRLHTARYGPRPDESQEVLLLLSEAKYWVRRWP